MSYRNMARLTAFIGLLIILGLFGPTGLFAAVGLIFAYHIYHRLRYGFWIDYSPEDE